MVVLPHKNKFYYPAKDFAAVYKKESGINTRSIKATMPEEFMKHSVPIKATLCIDIEFIKSLPYVSLSKLNINIESVPKEDVVVKKERKEEAPNYLTPVPGHPSVYFMLPKFEAPDDKLGFDNISMVGNNENRKNLFFSVNDVEATFGIKRVGDILRSEETGYVRDVHYVTLFMNNEVNSSTRKLRVENVKMHSSKCSMWLTYRGLVRLLNVSRGDRTKYNQFLDWMDEVLFTTQFGTEDNKIEMVKTKFLFTISREGIRQLIPSNASVSCIYLLKLDILPKLKANKSVETNLVSNECVYKYGLTNDLNRRIDEHRKTYKVEPQIVTLSMIEEVNLKDAENDVKEFFSNNKFSVQSTNRNELVIVPDEFIQKNVCKFYASLTEKYNKNLSLINADLLLTIANLNLQIEKLTKEYAIKEEKHNSTNLLKDEKMNRLNKEHELTMDIKDERMDRLNKEHELTMGIKDEKMDRLNKEHELKITIKDQQLEMLVKDLSIKDKEIEVLKLRLKRNE